MSFEYTSSYFIVILTGNKKKNRKWANGEETLHPSSTPFQPFPPVSFLTIIILSFGSKEVLLFLVLLIYINTHNRMEINLLS